MNNYIIDPKWFYIVQIVDSLRIFFGVIAFIALVAAFLWFLNEYISLSIGAVLLGLFLIVIAILIPKKETLIEMEVARHITYDNVGTVIEYVKDTTDKLVDKFTDNEGW